ncbi:response regulator transcription factor [Amycolatopsis acidicola]|uniref:Response regulator transcription factor n=1 Tax=Amycolatopsis acidicola TaxID=2596893 RepID=A0A5N0V233_9PSEU|nr:response regulator transcription factor [Amycolatopsis acidicola]KAA9157293.1 response regulator transcription factor [Amycolatopsis acidicola]
MGVKAEGRGRKPQVLVVDDEPNIRELLSSGLGLNGFDVRAVPSGGRALEDAAEYEPDIVVLDVGLPDMHGFTVARMLRSTCDTVPLLFLTARDGVEDRIAGLTAGGDDYVTKPFSIKELVLRLRAILRRSLPPEPDDDGLLRYSDLLLDEENQRVRRGEREICLSPTEFRLLAYLMRNSGQVLTKGQLLDRVWGQGVSAESRVVDSYISYLRRKIDAEGVPLIHTLRGVGYSLREASTRR